MIWIVAVAAGAVVASGVYLALSRNLLRSVIGISLVGAGANLAVLSAGRLGSAVPPIVPSGSSALSLAAANPLPQALALTAIVIGFSLTCFSLTLVLALWQRLRVHDSRSLRFAEPPPDPRPTAAEERGPR
jgi:multicomponent Na+:H+ antiporter subunit C